MKLAAYAKINLTLEVFGIRADGFHGLRSIVMPVTLADELEVSEAEDFSSDTGYADDLCVKAARAFDPRRGARISVVKRIPAGGGLGGGSADAAAVLNALNQMRGRGKTAAELAEIGAHVGSDVPALVLGGPVLMEGRGEIVRSLRERLKDMNPLDLVLANPGVGVSTAAVFKLTPDRGESAAENASERMIRALESGDRAEIAAAVMNDLTAPAIALEPKIGATLAALHEAGASGVTMSGSGTTVFGLAADADAARAIAAAMRERGYSAWAVETRV